MLDKTRDSLDMYRDDVMTIIEELTGNKHSVSIPFAFIRATEKLDRALFLAECLYWSSKSYKAGKDGWFYKKYSEWHSEVGLGEYEIRKSTKWFVERGLMETVLKKVAGAPTLHYRIKRDEFSEWILEKLKNPILRNSGMDSLETTESIYNSDSNSDKQQIPPTPQGGLAGETIQAGESKAVVQPERKTASARRRPRDPATKALARLEASREEARLRETMPMPDGARVDARIVIPRIIGLGLCVPRPTLRWLVDTWKEHRAEKRGNRIRGSVEDDFMGFLEGWIKNRPEWAEMYKPHPVPYDHHAEKAQWIPTDTRFDDMGWDEQEQFFKDYGVYIQSIQERGALMEEAV